MEKLTLRQLLLFLSGYSNWTLEHRRGRFTLKFAQRSKSKRNKTGKKKKSFKLCNMSNGANNCNNKSSNSSNINNNATSKAKLITTKTSELTEGSRSENGATFQHHGMDVEPRSSVRIAKAHSNCDTMESCDSLAWDYDYDVEAKESLDDGRGRDDAKRDNMDDDDDDECQTTAESEFCYYRSSAAAAATCSGLSSGQSTMDNGRAGRDILREMRELRSQIQRMTAEVVTSCQLEPEQQASKAAVGDGNHVIGESQSEAGGAKLSESRIREFLLSVAGAKTNDQDHVEGGSPDDGGVNSTNGTLEMWDSGYGGGGGEYSGGSGKGVSQDEKKEKESLEGGDDKSHDVVEMEEADDTKGSGKEKQQQQQQQESEGVTKSKKKRRRKNKKRMVESVSASTPKDTNSSLEPEVTLSLPTVFTEPSIEKEEDEKEEIRWAPVLRQYVNPKEPKSACPMRLFYRELFEWEASFCRRRRGQLAEVLARKSERALAALAMATNAAEGRKPSDTAPYKNPYCSVMMM